MQNAYINAVGGQNKALGNYLAGLNGAKASMGGYVKSLIGAKAASIGLQAASLALNAAISMGLSLAISALVSGISKWINKEKEAREQAIETANTAKEEVTNLTELLNKYNQLSEEVKTNASAKDDLIDTQAELLKTLGIEQSELDGLISKYGDLSTAINNVTLDALKDAQSDLLTGYKAYEKELIDAGRGYAHWYSLTDRNIIDAGGESSVDAFKVLEQANLLSKGSFGDGGGAFVLTGDDNTVEGILSNYEKLKNAQEALNKAVEDGTFTKEELSENTLYNAIAEREKELRSYVDNYNLAIDDVNENSASQQIITDLMGKELPKDAEEFEAFKQSLIDTAQESKNFIGTQEDIKDSIINALAEMPEFKQYFEDLAEVQSSTFNNETPILSFSDSISSLNDLSNNFDKINSAYQEFLEKGAQGVSTESLEGIASAFAEMEGVDTNPFLETLMSASSTAEEVQNAFNELATRYIYASGCLDNLTDATANQTIKELELQGVTNASIIVTSALAYQKAMSALNTDQLTGSIDSEIAKIASENNIVGESQQYLYRYALQKEIANGITLKTDGDIANITALVKGCGSGVAALQALARVRQEAEKVILPNSNDILNPWKAKQDRTEAMGNVINAYNNANAEIQAALNGTGGGNASNSSGSYTGNKSSGKSGGSGGSDTAKQTTETAETFDFIETLLSKLSSAFDKLKSKGENTLLSFTARSRAYSNSLTKVNEQINTLRSASDSYMAKANSFGLEEEWARQVRDGSLNIAEVTDDGLKERIKNYQTWYEKASACNDKIDELSKTQKELTQSKLELLITKYGQLADKAASANDRIENSISLKESYGGYGSVKDYKNLNKNNRVQIKYANTQINKYKELQKTVKKGSEEWYNYQKKIDSNRASVQKLTQSIFDNAKALAEQSKAKADVKIEKYDASDSLLNAKVGNAISYKDQNKFINEEIKNITRRQNAYNSAVSTDKAGITSAGRAISKTKTTKENKSLLKKIKSYIKSKKEIPSSLLSQAAKLSDNHLLYQKCVQYNAYVAAYETDKAAADLYKQQGAQEKADLAIQKQDNISKYYANRQKKYDQKATELNSAIDAATARGYQTSQNYYDTLVMNEKNRNGSLVTERGKLVRSLATSVKNGSIKKGTDEWYELCQQIDDVTNAINDSNLSLVEYENQIRQIKWDNFDNLQDRIRNITSELDFAINELSREDLASNETGRLTDNGNAVAALHASNYTTYLQQARDYETEISKIEKDIATDPYNQKLLDRRQDLIKSYQDAVTGAQDEKYAIIDLYTKGYDALTNKISDLISEYGKLLDAEKSAYDYQNNIADKTKEIANIRKMLDAYSGDISEEARTKVQSLTVSLADAEKDLKETQYDKYISDTKDMLSGLQEDFEKNIQEIIDSMSQNFGSLMQKIEAESQNSSNVIKKSLEDIGYKSSTEFASILDGSGISKATTQMIADTKNFQDKMTAYADTIANAAKTTNVTNEVNKKIQNDGSKALSTNLADSKKDVSSNKKSYTAQKEKREKAKIDKENAYYSYMDARGRFGKNSTQALQAKKIYEKAKAAYDEANSKYIKIKDNYNDAKVRSTVLDYLNKHLTVTSSSRSSYSDLNKVLYDQYGQRVLSNAEILELADILGVKFDNQKSSGALYKRLKEIGVKGFKVGSRSVPRDQLALLAEEGTELFFDKNQGILHQVGKGDKIFTNADTENLWNWAKMNPVQFSNSLNLPSALSSFEPNINSGDVTIDLGGIVMNGVNDVETFGRQIREEFCKNGKTTKCIVEAVSSEMLGKGIGNARLYR